MRDYSYLERSGNQLWQMFSKAAQAQQTNQSIRIFPSALWKYLVPQEPTMKPPMHRGDTDEVETAVRLPGLACRLPPYHHGSRRARCYSPSRATVGLADSHSDEPDLASLKWTFTQIVHTTKSTMRN